MAKGGRRGGPREGGGDREYDRDHEPDVEIGDDNRVHERINAARWIGSAPPSAQAYAHALAQWRQLPGAISTSATDLGESAGKAQPETHEAPAKGVQ